MQLDSVFPWQIGALDLNVPERLYQRVDALWEHFTFFFLLRMVLDVFLENLELGLKFLAVGDQRVHFLEQSFNLLVLFEGLKNHVFEFFSFLHCWIKNAFLDSPMSL